MTILHILEAMRQGWHCWSEIHPYFANHALGQWREWLCSR